MPSRLLPMGSINVRQAACDWRSAKLRRSHSHSRLTAPTAHRNQTASSTARTP